MQYFFFWNCCLERLTLEFKVPVHWDIRWWINWYNRIAIGIVIPDYLKSDEASIPGNAAVTISALSQNLLSITTNISGSKAETDSDKAKSGPGRRDMRRKLENGDSEKVSWQTIGWSWFTTCSSRFRVAFFKVSFLHPRWVANPSTSGWTYPQFLVL